MPSSNEPTRLLQKLPSHLLLRIMQCMDPKTMCRFRQTSKCIDKFSEENRCRLNHYRADSLWNLQISRSSKENWEMRGAKIECFIYKTDKVIDCGRFISDDAISTSCSRQKMKKILDPYAQLSGISIGVLHVKDFYSYRTIIYTEVGQDILGILRRLRLHVKWLLAECICTPELYSTLRFSKIYCANDRLSLSEMMIFTNMKVIQEVYWFKEVFPTSSACVSLLSQIEVLSITIEKYKDEECYTHLLKDVIQATGEMKKGTRTLKALRLRYRDHDVKTFFLPFETLHLFGFSPNEDNVDLNTRLDFHKLVFDQVVVIFLDARFECYEYLEVLFIDDYSRSALFDAIWSFFYPIRPATNIFRGFLNAETEQEAIKYLRQSTALKVQYDTHENIRPTFKKAKSFMIDAILK